MTNFRTLSTSVNVYGGKIVFCGHGADGNHTYLFDPEHRDMVSVDHTLHQFIFSFDSGLWEDSPERNMQKLYF